MKPIADRAFAFLQGLYRLQSTAELSQWIVNQLPNVFGVENAILCQHDGAHKVITSVVAQHPFSRGNMMPAINESGIMAMHPFWETIFDTERPARPLSELVARRAWHSNPLYQEVFRPDGIEDQMNIEVLGDKNHFTSINLLRACRGFHRDEVALFAQLRVHITQAFMNAQLVEKSRLLENNGQLQHHFMIDCHGKINRSDHRSCQVLAYLFNNRGELPNDVAGWVEKQVHRFNQGLIAQRVAPLKYQFGGKTWIFSLHRNFENQCYHIIATTLQPRPAQCGLSQRENEVLDWVAQGKSNDQISEILGISVNTLKTHLKRIFTKLGVENRTAAVQARNTVR